MEVFHLLQCGEDDRVPIREIFFDPPAGPRTSVRVRLGAALEDFAETGQVVPTRIISQCGSASFLGGLSPSLSRLTRSYGLRRRCSPTFSSQTKGRILFEAGQSWSWARESGFQRSSPRGRLPQWLSPTTILSSSVCSRTTWSSTVTRSGPPSRFSPSTGHRLPPTFPRGRYLTAARCCSAPLAAPHRRVGGGAMPTSRLLSTRAISARWAGDRGVAGEVH